MCLTANHRNVGFDLLDRLSTATTSATAEVVAGGPAVQGAVVLATCNRFEAYLDVDGEAPDAPAAVDHTIDVMSAAGGVEADALRDAVSVMAGPRAIEHLFAVAAGLQSVAVGEDQIGGQVRRAYEQARRDGLSSTELDRVFQRATRTAREVRARGDLAGADRSLVRLALDLASSRIADWSATRVLVVGTGRYAQVVVAALRARGVRELSVFSPTGRGAAFAAKYSLALAAELASGIRSAQVVVTCTAQGAVVPAEAFDGVDKVLAIDLGLPRNIDPAVAEVDGVTLLDLEVVARHAPLPEFQVDDAAALVRSAAAELEAERAVAPVIVALRGSVERLLARELERARRRSPSEQTSAATEEALRHFAGVLLHDPTVRARALAGDGRLGEVEAALATLFGLAPVPAETNSAEAHGA